LNSNYVVVKQNINKLLAVGFIKPIEESTWLFPIVVICKWNGKLRICVDFRKFNATTKKDPYSLPFIDEVINTIIGHEVYTFLNEFPKYYQISIAPNGDFAFCSSKFDNSMSLPLLGPFMQCSLRC
jgi:hypothetical protein